MILLIVVGKHIGWRQDLKKEIKLFYETDLDFGFCCYYFHELVN